MSLVIGDRIQKSTEARRFRPGYEPEWIEKATTFNPDEVKLPSSEADLPVEVGTLEPGDAYQQVGGSHGLVKAAARNGFVLINDGGPDRYIVASTMVIRSAPDSPVAGPLG